MTITTHTYKGFTIQPYGLGYEAQCGNNWLYANKWTTLERMIDELIK